jgi:hypothetical protein
VALIGGLFVGSAIADSNHGSPDCSSLTLVNEPAFGSRDGFDHQHATNAAVPSSLAELEGYLNVCRTNDATIVEAVSASARAVRVSGVVRVQLRAQLLQWVDGPDAGDAPDQWALQQQSVSVNTGLNRTLTVTTPYLDEIDSTPLFQHTWTRASVRALVRYSNGQLIFHQFYTYPIWTGDGPVTPMPA